MELTTSGYEAEVEKSIASSRLEKLVAVVSKCTLEVLPKSLIKPVAVLVTSCAQVVLTGPEGVIMEPEIRMERVRDISYLSVLLAPVAFCVRLWPRV